MNLKKVIMYQLLGAYIPVLIALYAFDNSNLAMLIIAANVIGWLEGRSGCWETPVEPEAPEDVHEVMNPRMPRCL